MKTLSKKRMSTEALVLGAMMTALVVVFQCLATYTTWFGPFSTAIGLIPIVIGASLCGVGVGAWLGLVFGAVVLFTGGGSLFFMFSIPGTIITVLAKGTACGAAAGIANELFKKTNDYVAALASAIVCPIVNTGVFLIGCAIFFSPFANEIAAACGLEVTGMQVFIALAAMNFLFELGLNVVLSPAIVKLINIAKKYNFVR